MAVITENCPLVALIKSCCVSRKVLVTEAGQREHGVSAPGPLTCLLDRLVQQVARQSLGISGHESLEHRLTSCSHHWSGDVSQAWEVWRPTACCMSKTLTKSKGLHFVWDDIKCCKGEKPVFCSCCSETLLQFYT